MCPTPNSLSLVYREKDLLHFTKYLNHRTRDLTRGPLYTTNLTYVEHSDTAQGTSEGGDEEKVWGSEGGDEEKVWGSEGGDEEKVWGSEGGDEEKVWGSEGGDEEKVWGSEGGDEEKVWGSEGGDEEKVWGSEGGDEEKVWGSEGGDEEKVWGSIGVGTGGARGARPPQYINQGGPSPPNVGDIEGILTVKIHIPAKAQTQILTSKISTCIHFTHIKKQACARICIYVYVTQIIRPSQYRTSSYSTG